jgi:hypothetical protein
VTVATESVCLSGESETSGAVGINYGIQSQVDRSMLTLYSSGSFTSFGIEYDRILATEFFMPELRPYAGLNLGIVYYDEPEDDNYGFYYGVNLGLMLYASDNIDIDLSYYYNGIEGLESTDRKQGARLLFHYFY